MRSRRAAATHNQPGTRTRAAADTAATPATRDEMREYVLLLAALALGAQAAEPLQDHGELPQLSAC